MDNIAIIAPTGMLGSSVYRALKDRYLLTLVVRNTDGLEILNERYGDVNKHRIVIFPTDQLYAEYLKGFTGKNISPTMHALTNDLSEVQYVINCAGVINRYSREKPEESMFINGALPHLLSFHLGKKLIHITTDCVYDGVSGAPYDEDSKPNPSDLYGASKSMGEPSKNSLVFRTSIIGPEIRGFISLLEWVRAQEGKKINGFTKHLWNGITTVEFGRVCSEIIEHPKSYPETGLYHIFSTDITKFDMITKIAKKYGVQCEITPEDANMLDRRLRSKFDVCERLQIPSFDEMLAQL